MLTRDRPEMAARAVRCFREQTYQSKRLMIYNANTAVEYGHIPGIPGITLGEGVIQIPAGSRGLSIGAMRNDANQHADYQILIHWDDDDWSHPNRIAEQVALLQASGKECVGYKDLLFWRETPGRENLGEAWLWKHPLRGLPGTSLCYWRKTWEQWPFPDLPKNNASEGEDMAWLRGVDSLGVSSLMGWDDPRMIASIHGSNTMAYTDALLSESTSWVRVPQFDQLCRERMAL